MSDDVIVRLRDLPMSIKGFISPSPDGAYNIYINSRQSHEVQLETLAHELEHIINGDFSAEEHIGVIERG